MEITPEILSTALADETLRNAAITALESTGLLIRTPEQDATFVQSRVDPLVEQRIKDQIKAVHEQYDHDLLELTGDRKAPNEKTYDFLKRKIADLKSQKPQGVEAERLKELERLLEAERTSKKSEIEKMQAEFMYHQLDTTVSTSIDQFGIALPIHLQTDEEKQAFASNQRQMIKRDFLSNFQAKKDNEGKIVFYKGEELLLSKKDGKPLTATEIIQDSYKAYFVEEKKRTQGGAGSGQGGDQSAFTNKQQLIQYLEAKGVKQNTKAFLDEYGKLVKEHGLIN